MHLSGETPRGRGQPTGGQQFVPPRVRLGGRWRLETLSSASPAAALRRWPKHYHAPAYGFEAAVHRTHTHRELSDGAARSSCRYEQSPTIEAKDFQVVMKSRVGPRERTCNTAMCVLWGLPTSS